MTGKNSKLTGHPLRSALTPRERQKALAASQKLKRANKKAKARPTSNKKVTGT